jgi:hypothetical protein
MFMVEFSYLTRLSADTGNFHAAEGVFWDGEDFRICVIKLVLQ